MAEGLADRPGGDDTELRCFFCFKSIHDHCLTTTEAMTCLERLPTRDGAEGAEALAATAENAVYQRITGPGVDAMRAEAKRLVERAKLQSYPSKILDDCIAFLLRFSDHPLHIGSSPYITPLVRGDREAITRLIYEADSPSDPKDAWKEAQRVTDVILSILIQHGTSNG